MATYISLVNYTDQGIKAIKDSPKRLAAAEKMFAEYKVKIKEFYLLMGEYDIMVVLEAPDDESVSKAALKLGSLGNVRTKTMRAYPRQEFDRLAGGIS